MIKRGPIIILIVIAILIAQSPSKAWHSIPLRVCVLKDASRLTLTIKGYYRIFTLKTDELIKEGNDLRWAEVSPTMSGLLISGEPFNIYGIKIVPERDASIYIGERSFRGNLDIIRTENKRLLAINHVDMEDYLKGVLYHEVSHWWPMETLKAQAIASRTYAIYQRSKNKSEDFDLTSDIYSQVYGGKISERMKTNRAVDLTQGKVLTYKGKIFPTYYHATCGGYTEDASNLWDIDIVPLDGIRCDFCKHSPHNMWKCKILTSSIEEKLRGAGYKIDGLKKIELQGETSSHRVEELKLVSDKEELLIQAKDFRLIMGPNLIRSTNFNIETKGRYTYFYGRGWGHGVGMCQWGAFFLGLKRYRLEEILRYYYPETEILRYEISEDFTLSPRYSY